MVAEPLVVLQRNVEGLTRSKRDIIHHLADVHEVNVLLLQETHATNEEKLKIEGFETVAFTSSKHYGLATYIRDGLRAISIRKSSTDNLAEWIVSTVNGIDIVNIYKPPKVKLDIEALPYISTSSIVCGDFNSRHGSWGYPDSNQNGNLIESWAESFNLLLLFDTKASPSFFSKRHKTWTNPDLTFISANMSSRSQRDVLDLFPRSGHCPILVRTNSNLRISTINKKRWNFRIADWKKFENATNRLTRDLPDPHGNKTAAHTAFTNMLLSAAKASIPRGRRSNYIPCWDKDCDSALSSYNSATEEEKKDKCDHLFNILDEKRRKRWEETVSNVDFTHSSRKAWQTVNKLTGRSNTAKSCPVTADSIATVLIKNGKWQQPKDTQQKRTTFHQ